MDDKEAGQAYIPLGVAVGDIKGVYKRSGVKRKRESKNRIEEKSEFWLFSRSSDILKKESSVTFLTFTCQGSVVWFCEVRFSALATTCTPSFPVRILTDDSCERLNF